MSISSLQESIRSLAQDRLQLGDGFDSLRSSQLEVFETLTLPTKKHEEWKYLSLRDASKLELTDASSASEVDVQSYLFEESDGLTAVFINGEFNASLSSLTEALPDSSFITTFKQASEEQKEAIRTHLGTYPKPKDDFFFAANGSTFEDGIFISLSKNVVVEKPIHILNVFTEDNQERLFSPRCLVLADQHAECTIVESSIGVGKGMYVTIPVTEMNLSAGAHIKHFKIQRDSKSAYHFNRTGTKVDQHSHYESYSIQLGAAVSRVDAHAELIGKECNCTLDGLVLLNGHQVSDSHTLMDHQQPHCNSHQLHKVVVDGNAQSIFNGKIWVHQAAQKTDSFQENRNIILSDDATVDTKPQLEIFADDVKCSHGATIGQLSDEELFYLTSRGVTPSVAKEMLITGFALEVIENFGIPTLEAQLAKEVAKYAHTIVDQLLEAV